MEAVIAEAMQNPVTARAYDEKLTAACTTKEGKNLALYVLTEGQMHPEKKREAEKILLDAIMETAGPHVVEALRHVVEMV
jgi:hypothetical protein